MSKRFNKRIKTIDNSQSESVASSLVVFFIIYIFSSFFIELINHHLLGYKINQGISVIIETSVGYHQLRLYISGLRTYNI